MKSSVFMIFLLATASVFPQAPYAEIPPYPEGYSAGTVAARLIDGLGFRFYWATEGLSESEVQFSPGGDSRSITETVDHIYGMSFLIANTVLPQERKPDTSLSYGEKRLAVLQNLFDMREILITSSDEEFDKYQARFSNGVAFPFWNMLNGPIADSIWHCGQIVMMRRLAGNPFNSKVSLFNGKLREE